MPMPPFFSPSEEQVVIADYRSGKSSGRIARERNCSTQTVLNVLARNGVSLRRTGSHNRRLWTDEELEDIRLMWESGEARTAIARKHRAGIEAISRILTETLGFRITSARFRKGPRAVNWKGGRKETAQGYVVVWIPDDHAFAAMRNKSGYVPEHRLVMAEQLGRPLLPGETVHHINGVKDDNALGNLQLRMGRHGYGQVLRCRCCGSHDIEALPLEESK